MQKNRFSDQRVFTAKSNFRKIVCDCACITYTVSLFIAWIGKGNDFQTNSFVSSPIAKHRGVALNTTYAKLFSIN
jgi:hypothetical protein